jgi:hypothetical protein
MQNPSGQCFQTEKYRQPMPYVPWPMRLWPLYNDPHWLDWTRSTYDRYRTDSWYTSKGLAEAMVYAMDDDISSSQGNWTRWDPAAGSGRIYDNFSGDRYASDLRKTSLDLMRVCWNGQLFGGSKEALKSLTTQVNYKTTMSRDIASISCSLGRA